MDFITKKEATALGIIGADGLGFVKPQTAFKNINERLLAEIKKGNLVWRQGWKNGITVKGVSYGPQNYETQRPYSGGNAFFIGMMNLLNGTDYRFFLTAKQIAGRGGKLKKEAKPFQVSVYIVNQTPKTITREGKDITIIEEEKGVIWYHVFPIENVEGLKPIVRKTKKPDNDNEIIVSDAETIIENMPKAPQIKIGGDKAFYSPGQDFVQMPAKKAFKVQQEYYSVLFHELIHSTGHKKRLNRDMKGSFGTKPYAFEELIAELGSAYLCGVSEIDYYTVNNSAAYLKGWAKRLTEEIENDPQFLKRAVFKAAKAASFIIGKTLEKQGIIKEARLMTLKAKKTGSDLFPELSGVEDKVLMFFNSFLQMHNRTVTKDELIYILTDLQSSIKGGLIKATHPLKELVNLTQGKLVKLINSLRANEHVKVHIGNKTKIENEIRGLHGLGFWNVIASAVIGKSAELLANKHLFKKKEEPKPVSEPEPAPALNGIDSFVRADDREEVEAPDTYKLPGEIGKILGNIQPFKYSIVLTGDPHAGKTEVVTQLINAFCEAGKTVGAYMLEQGGMESKDTKEAIDRNITPKNQKNLFVTGEAVKGLDTVKEQANLFDVIVVDSWQKLNVPSTRFDELRHEHPSKIFITIFQQNGKGGTRGGVSADYDTPVLLKVHKVDETFVNNYVEVKKNRGNGPTLSLKYMVKAKKTVTI